MAQKQRAMVPATNYFVEVVEFGADGEDGPVEKRMGPMSYRRAEKVDDGVNINLNHERFFTRIVRGGE